jgi:hypothetical protein
MTTTIAVICTGKGDHGRIDFDSFTVDGGNIEHVNVRRGRSPIQGQGTAVEDGAELPISIGARMVVPVKPAQADNGTWRWRCPQCGRDRPLANANLRKALLGLAANSVLTLDVSLLP